MKKVWNILSTAIPIAIILFCFLGFLFAPNDPSVTDVMNKYQSASAQYNLTRIGREWGMTQSYIDLSPGRR